jgi:hypothetical protein
MKATFQSFIGKQVTKHVDGLEEWGETRQLAVLRLLFELG